MLLLPHRNRKRERLFDWSLRVKVVIHMVDACLPLRGFCDTGYGLHKNTLFFFARDGSFRRRTLAYGDCVQVSRVMPRFSCFHSVARG